MPRDAEATSKLRRNFIFVIEVLMLFTENYNTESLWVLFKPFDL